MNISSYIPREIRIGLATLIVAVAILIVMRTVMIFIFNKE